MTRPLHPHPPVSPTAPRYPHLMTMMTFTARWGMSTSAWKPQPRHIRIVPGLLDDRVRSDLGTPEGVSCDVAAPMPPHVIEHLDDLGIAQRLDRILRRLEPDQGHGVRRCI